MATFTTKIKDYIESFTDFRDLDATTDQKIERGRPFLFNFEYEFYSKNSDVKMEFERQFIRHFYFSEIGFETVGLFKMRLRDKLDMIMPRYIELFNSRAEIGKILENNKMTYGKDSTTDYRNNNLQTNTAITKSQTTSDSNTQDINSTNPQTTFARNDFASSMNRGRTESNVLTNGNDTATSHNEGRGDSGLHEKSTSSGWMGSKSDEIMKFRRLILSLNEEIFSELDELFMQVYGSFSLHGNDFNMVAFGTPDNLGNSIDWGR